MLAANCGAAISRGAEVAPVSDMVQIPEACVAQMRSTQIVFVDSSIDDINQLMNGLSAGHELVLLQPNQNGLDQISQVLSQRSNVQSIHIVAHGQAGQIQ
ncbi:hypothetical protein K239x_16090 [Planctomycetes bacterium K23_9]|uniref:DUF4347 domain-containing protein n=1 Tax=Stieleria marina TaxID=1930275 RepID=A0A517NRA5_9BACT|nr:hypothetical protein K239x_16090 [Planctomycetes bacterium K23_9]